MRYRKYAFATLLAAGLSTGLGHVVSAADIPSAAQATARRPVAASTNWTGPYAGGVLGYGWGESRHCDPGFPCPTFSADTNLKGWVGGGTLGFNWQWSNWVLGVEGDWSWGKLKGTSPAVPTFGCGGGTPTCATSVTSIGTIRGRLGVAFNQFLPYFTAGAAVSRLKASIGNPGPEATTTKTKFVWGAGIEAALAPQWSAKVEYLRTSSLGDFIYDNGTGCGAATPCYVSVKSINIVRVGVNYRFGAR